MAVGKICTRVTHTVDPHESVRAAAQRMDERGVGTLVCVDDDGRPLGVVTDRDLTTRCTGRGLDADSKEVSEVMSTPPAAVEEQTPIESALSMMADRGVRRLVVVDGEGRLVGILSLDDVLELLVEEVSAIGRILQSQSKPTSRLR
jgi:signal-transduction protein with cAMP-binding, CBS, and nucleotidyltransferase domain